MNFWDIGRRWEMKLVKKGIPLWMKCPIYIFLNEAGKIPLRLVLAHMYCGFIDSRNSTEEMKKKAYATAKKRTYKYLEIRYKKLALNLIQKPELGTEVNNAPIWILWWQGEKNAPDIVKHCISSIKRNSGDHPVKIVDSQNYEEFVNVPEHIAEKFAKGVISITHFSDYYRMALLEKHGGLWIDGSIFVKQKIDDFYFKIPLFTLKNPGKDQFNISNWEWTVGVIGGWKGNTLFRAVRRLLEVYWKDYNVMIDYFVFDYMIKMVYENSSFLKKVIQSVPSNSSHFYYLQDNVNQCFDEIANKAEFNSDTTFYKISWKGKYFLKTPEGEDTVYSRWLKECMDLETETVKRAK